MSETHQKFEKPRHWMALEELTPDYWADAETQKLLGQEFVEKPIEALEKIEKSDNFQVTRREFLTVMGASMAMASFACARRPVHKIIPYVVQPQEVTPGIAVHYASTCKECAMSCGTVVKAREGRPIKIEGNELSSATKGGLCARGQASVLNLYDTDRIQKPMKGAKGGSKSASDWKEIDSLVVAALKESKRVRIVSLPDSSPSTRRLMKEFMSGFQDARWIEVDPLGADDVIEGQAEAYGSPVFPVYSFHQADVVLSFNADFLGTWGNTVTQSAQWAQKRKLVKAADSMSKLFVVEGNLSLTGSNADERVPVLPGAEVLVATAVAQELILNQKKTRFAGAADVVESLKSSGSQDELLSKAGGVTKEFVKRVADQLWESRGRSLVLGSGGKALQSVVNLLNSALENEGKTVDGNGDAIPSSQSLRSLVALQAEMNSGSVDTVIFYKSNPAYFLPNSTLFTEALKKVKTVVAVADRVDETAEFADVVAALNHSLESWGDAQPVASQYSLQQPTIAPLFDTRSFEDCVIQWVKSGVKTQGLLAQVAASSDASFYAYVKENWKQTLFPKFGKGQAWNDFWETTLQKGLIESTPAPARERSYKPAVLRGLATAVSAFKTSTIATSKKGPATEAQGVVLGLYETIALGDGRNANNPWLQELPDPISTITWDNYANIGPSFAQELGLKANDVVLVTVGEQALELPVNIQPGIAKGAMTIALGYGRTQVGKIGNKVGSNAFRLAALTGEQGLVLSGQTAKVAKTGKKYELAVVQGHHRTEGRPIVNDITLAEFKKDPKASAHTNPHMKMDVVPTMWNPPHDYAKEPYRWMMAVDLNACTGCGACVIACQAENNIPVVGRDRVRQGREMHWMRIDRFYSGDENSPQVVFQPMMCQHCENAPCETVCPVVATSHSNDGLNQMTYSRCVGTRYCQNNCPYKVRRFNFFDHWKDYKDTMNMVWNPDVTVRSRGIMEKCSFCVQRINEAKSHAKDKKSVIKDKDLKTACQQTCPTEAIVFGNVNDPESAVAKVKDQPRAFRVLEILNTKPVVHYLTKVRNVESSHQEAGHGHHS